MRLPSRSIRAISSLLVLCLGITGFSIPTAQAGMVGTQAALAVQAAAQNRAQVKNILSRDEVRQGLLARGVDPAQVQARVAGLNDTEVQQLATDLDRLPAGGDGLELLLLVFILLLITDIAGITHIFNFVHHKR